MKTDILMNGSMVKIHISLKTGFGYNVIVRNFVPIVVPGLSASSSSGSDPSSSRTLSRQEILRIQNPLLEEHCAFLEVIHLFQ